MRVKPKSSTKKQAKPKNKYIVTIEDEEYETFASSEAGAISNGIFRHAMNIGEDVGLVRWKVNNFKITAHAELEFD